MKLYLVRHGTAEDIAQTDAARRLTPRGEQEARTVGRALAALGADCTHVFSSPLLRARQTAEIAGRELNLAGRIGTLDELLNGTPTGMLLQVVTVQPDAREILLIGHMPSINGHVIELTSCGRMAGFTPGAIACVELPDGRPNSGKLLWFKQHYELQT